MILASDSVELEALIHPNASIIGSNNVTVLNGTIHEITCEVTAKPKPKILWFKGRDRLSTRAVGIQCIFKLFATPL